MSQERIGRREFLRRTALMVSGGGLVTLLGCDSQTIKRLRVREGELISERDHTYTIEISNGGDPSIRDVRVRSHWRIVDSKDPAVDMNTRAGMVKVGTTLESVGMVRGYAGTGGDQTFWAVRKEELLKGGERRDIDLLDQTYERYYINNRYAKLLFYTVHL